MESVKAGAVVTALVLVLTACSSGEADRDPAPAPAESAAPGVSRSAPLSGPTADDDLPPVRHPGTLPTLMRHQWRASRIRVGEVLERTDAYTRYHVTYRSDSLDITGQLLRPHGRGPFPGMFFIHV